MTNICWTWRLRNGLVLNSTYCAIHHLTLSVCGRQNQAWPSSASGDYWHVTSNGHPSVPVSWKWLLSCGHLCPRCHTTQCPSANSSRRKMHSHGIRLSTKPLSGSKPSWLHPSTSCSDTMIIHRPFLCRYIQQRPLHLPPTRGQPIAFTSISLTDTKA